MSPTQTLRFRKLVFFVCITAIFSFFLIAHAEESSELYQLVIDLNDKLTDVGFQLNLVLQGVELLAGILLVGFGSVMGFLSIREVLRIWRS